MGQSKPADFHVDAESQWATAPLIPVAQSIE
jgi:hypothetical protein